MNATPEPNIRVRVDPTNPGQFFACCGLLELADRVWKGAEGWFENGGVQFSLRPIKIDTTLDYSPFAFLNVITMCPLSNTMTKERLARRDELSSLPRKMIEADLVLKSEKKHLDKLWRESPVAFQAQIDLLIDWFLDDRAGGETFKTWAGQQSVFEIAQGMKLPLNTTSFREISTDEWLYKRMPIEALPFYFDSDLGETGSDLDLGFSIDPLQTVKVQARPLLELLAFVGLQRFRPTKINAENRFRFFLWFYPFVPEVASTAACGLFSLPLTKVFEFRLRYRTKYLKSFLTATQIERR